MAAMSNQRLAAGMPFFFKQRGGDLTRTKQGICWMVECGMIVFGCTDRGR